MCVTCVCVCHVCDMTWLDASTPLLSWHTLQHTATHCNTLQHTATHCNTLATHCNTLQRTATHCNLLQLTVTHCNTLKRNATHCNAMQHTATYCSTLQHTATYCSTRQDTARYCNRLKALTLEVARVCVCVCVCVHMCVCVCARSPLVSAPQLCTVTHSYLWHDWGMCDMSRLEVCKYMYASIYLSIFKSQWLDGVQQWSNRHPCRPRHTATHCNTLQHTAAHCNALQNTIYTISIHTIQTATHCNTRAGLLLSFFLSLSK